jgi:hypothetical protein
MSYEEEGIEGGEATDKGVIAFIAGVVAGALIVWLI